MFATLAFVAFCIGVGASCNQPACSASSDGGEDIGLNDVGVSLLQESVRVSVGLAANPIQEGPAVDVGTSTGTSILSAVPVYIWMVLMVLAWALVLVGFKNFAFSHQSEAGTEKKATLAEGTENRAPLAGGDSTISSEDNWIDNLTPFQRKLGLVAMLASALCFALMALLVKELEMRGYGKFELVFWRSAFMTMIATYLCSRRGINPLGDKKDLAILTARGIAGFSSVSFFYAAINALPLSDAVVMMTTSPVYTAIFGAILFGDAFDWIDGVGTVLSIAGVVLVSEPSFIPFFGTGHPLPLDGVAFAIAAAVSTTVVHLLLRMGKGIEPSVASNHFAMWGAVLGPVLMLATGETTKIPSSSEFVLILGLAALSVLAQNLMTAGIALESVGKAAAMNYTQVGWSALFQVFILQDYSGCDLQSLIGVLLIVAWGGVALVKDVQKKNSSPSVN